MASSELGWTVIQEYVQKFLADDSEDERGMNRDYSEQIQIESVKDEYTMEGNWGHHYIR